MTASSKTRTAALTFSALLCGLPLYAQEAPNPSPGATKEHAIEVCDPVGERAYLARLVCPDSSHPTFNRIGSIGMRNDFQPGMSEDDQMKEVMSAMTGQKLDPGQTDRHVIDSYDLQCGAKKRTVYLDMYHCDAPVPQQAPEGFTIFN